MATAYLCTFLKSTLEGLLKILDRLANEFLVNGEFLALRADVNSNHLVAKVAILTVISGKVPGVLKGNDLRFQRCRICVESHLICRTRLLERHHILITSPTSGRRSLAVAGQSSFLCGAV